MWLMYLLLCFISSSAAESGAENATYNPCLTANNDSLFEGFKHMNELIENGMAINTTYMYTTSYLLAGESVWHQCPADPEDVVCVLEPNSHDAVDLATDEYYNNELKHYTNGAQLKQPRGVCTERSDKSQWVKLTLDSNSGPDKEFVYVVANCSVVYCIRKPQQGSCNSVNDTNLVGAVRHLVLCDTSTGPAQSTVSISPSQSSAEAPTTSELTRTVSISPSQSSAEALTTSELTRTVSISPSQSSPEAPTTSELTSTCIFQTTAEMCACSTSSTVTVVTPTVRIDVLKSNEVRLSSSEFTGVIIVTASVTAGAILLVEISLYICIKIKSANKAVKLDTDGTMPNVPAISADEKEPQSDEEG